VTKVAVITGWDRSGSTIIADALGSTDGVISVGEINNLWDRGFGSNLVCSCEASFSECEEWRAIAEKAFGSDHQAVARQAAHAMEGMGNTWLVRRHLPMYEAPGKEAAYARLLAGLYEGVVEHSHARLIVDASKTPWHTAVAMELEGFEVYVLHVVRDPRGVAHSLGKNVRYDTDNDKAIYMDRHGVTFSSLAWVYRNRLTESEWGGSGRYLRLRYEDFVADPAASLRGFFDFIGEPELSVPFTEDGRLLLSPSHNISGNPSRFHHGPVRLRVDDVWREALPPAVAAYVRLITWPHMAHYGYR
jgi:hypothetical protein